MFKAWGKALQQYSPQGVTMRISTVIGSTLTAIALAGGITVGHLGSMSEPSPVTTMLMEQAAHAAPVAAKADPAEDSPQFDCRKHGNRKCGVTLDPKPSNGKREAVRYVIQFNKAGQPVSVAPLGR